MLMIISNQNHTAIFVIARVIIGTVAVDKHFVNVLHSHFSNDGTCSLDL